MGEVIRGRIEVDWPLPLCGVVAAVVIFLPTLIAGYSFGAFILSGLLAIALCVTLLAVAAFNLRRKRVPVLLMLLTFCLISWCLFKVAYEIHTEVRWVFESHAYKARVLAQTEAANGELRHVEWDSWGGPGAGDTTVYLVFDPADSLLMAAKKHASGKLAGIPCPVAEVRRFQSHWFTVMPYTETDWNQCS